MGAIPAFDVNRTSRRIVSALAGVAVALTMIRHAFTPDPGRAEQVGRTDTV